MTEPILEVRDLKVHFPTHDGVVKAVDGISFSLMPGERLGVVGESGSGKSVGFLTVMGLITRKHAKIEGEIIFKGVNLLSLAPDEMRKFRGQQMAMVFQDPLSSLHPFYKVGDQIVQAIRAHTQMDKKEAFDRAVDILRRVGLPQPEDRARQFPHEFSGGMRQRAMIAMALVLNPDLLIADEPTTALDVTVQAQILELMDRIRDEFQTAVVMITHDLGVVAEHTDRVQVMYAGKLVETGSRDQVYYEPHHPYTWGLLQSIAHVEVDTDRLRPIKGSPPSLIFTPPGCAFHPRCPYRFEPCDKEAPDLIEEETDHFNRCYLSLKDKKSIYAREVALPT
ncbi:MAG: ABC transporter ATP-binding protein [Actinomycetota bacterium]